MPGLSKSELLLSSSDNQVDSTVVYCNHYSSSAKKKFISNPSARMGRCDLIFSMCSGDLTWSFQKRTCPYPSRPSLEYSIDRTVSQVQAPANNLGGDELFHSVEA